MATNHSELDRLTAHVREERRRLREVLTAARRMREKAARLRAEIRAERERARALLACAQACLCRASRCRRGGWPGLPGG